MGERVVESYGTFLRCFAIVKAANIYVVLEDRVLGVGRVLSVVRKKSLESRRREIAAMQFSWWKSSRGHATVRGDTAFKGGKERGNESTNVKYN